MGVFKPEHNSLKAIWNHIKRKIEDELKVDEKTIEDINNNLSSFQNGVNTIVTAVNSVAGTSHNATDSPSDIANTISSLNSSYNKIITYSHVAYAAGESHGDIVTSITVPGNITECMLLVIGRGNEPGGSFPSISGGINQILFEQKIDADRYRGESIMIWLIFCKVNPGSTITSVYKTSHLSSEGGIYLFGN